MSIRKRWIYYFNVQTSGFIYFNWKDFLLKSTPFEGISTNKLEAQMHGPPFSFPFFCCCYFFFKVISNYFYLFNVFLLLSILHYNTSSLCILSCIFIFRTWPMFTISYFFSTNRKKVYLCLLQGLILTWTWWIYT